MKTLHQWERPPTILSAQCHRCFKYFYYIFPQAFSSPKKIFQHLLFILVTVVHHPRNISCHFLMDHLQHLDIPIIMRWPDWRQCSNWGQIYKGSLHVCPVSLLMMLRFTVSFIHNFIKLVCQFCTTLLCSFTTSSALCCISSFCSPNTQPTISSYYT